MASLDHAPACCVTSVGTPTSLNHSVREQGRGSKGLGQRRSWQV